MKQKGIDIINGVLDEYIKFKRPRMPRKKKKEMKKGLIEFMIKYKYKFGKHGKQKVRLNYKADFFNFIVKRKRAK